MIEENINICDNKFCSNVAVRFFGYNNIVMFCDDHANEWIEIMRGKHQCIHRLN